MQNLNGKILIILQKIKVLETKNLETIIFRGPNIFVPKSVIIFLVTKIEH